MPSKFFAYRETPDEITQIDVFQALSLRNEHIKNQNAVPVFWDSMDKLYAEEVYPRNARTPHFCYFPGSKRAGNPSTMSLTHKAHQLVISELHSMTLSTPTNSVRIYIKSSQIECFFCVKENRYYLDVLLELNYTNPSSYYYKWSGKIAIEVKVTHSVDMPKIMDLSDSGFQIFEFETPNQDSYYKGVVDEANYHHLCENIRAQYRNRKCYIRGLFINDVIPNAGTSSERMYNILANFEKEEFRLRKITAALEDNYKKKYEKYRSDLEKQAKQIQINNEIIDSSTMYINILDNSITAKQSIIHNIENKISKNNAQSERLAALEIENAELKQLQERINRNPLKRIITIILGTKNR